jgi:hypothetical protein
MSDDLITCSAELTHAHGVSRCRLDPGHTDQHSGYCRICEEYDYAPTLEWTEDGEDWTRHG